MDKKQNPIELPQIVVTGAAGFIGRRVVARLVQTRAKVVAVDRRSPPEKFPAEVEYYRVDVGNDFPAIQGDFVLVHLAWNMDRGNPEAQEASFQDTSRLLERAGLHSVVGMGSAEEYGELEGRLNEAMEPSHPLSPYGQAKHEVRIQLEAWSRKPGRKAFWLRPFIAYGSGQIGNMAIPYALRCARERTPAEFSEGLQFRDFVHVDDVAEGIAQVALRLPHLAGSFTICNLGRSEPVRLRDVLERIAGQTHTKDLFRFGARPMRANEPIIQFADVSTAEQLLDWQARIPWTQGIDALCQEAIQ